MKRISIKDFSNIKIGNAENVSAGTGCTVIISESGMCAGLDVRGGGPASRESELLKPLAQADAIHAVVLGGGSAFGLDAAGGVMQFLEERGIGFDVGVTKVPLVCQSDIFDLSVADSTVRPDKAMGYEACKNAYADNYQDGNYGAGVGATVGKLMGMDYCMKSGIGSYAVQVGELQLGAVVVVNSLGDIYDYQNGKIIAGMLAQDHKTFAGTEDVMFRSIEVHDNKFVGNTTIGAIITNGAFNKSQLCKIAGMAHNGYARSIRPVHTTADGDSIYALSVGKVEADLDMAGTLAAKVMSEAISQAVKSAKKAYGYPAYEDIMI
ncbi:MAG: P1 family peptidase [Lachnospiraceae bacterium]|nr:P1 family peptidase [Lachnospiraceae bacterium]